MGVKSFGLRHALLMSAAAFGISVGAAAVAQPAYAQEATRSYDIPSQDLDDALREFGRQTGRDVLFTPAAVANKRSGAVQGQMTERQALETLLAGSGLRFEQTASNGYAVQDPSSPTQLGVADRAASSEEEEIVVTGSRLARAGDGPAPVVVFGRERIDQLGVTNVADVLEYLPQNSFSANEQATVGGSRRIQLRGLGIGTTLVLINGRRTITGALTGSRNYFDLNTIPLSAVDRIEVLSDSASAVYGADAVGGVVNIVTKRAVERPTLDLYYGAAEGGADEERVSFAAGHNGERLRASIIFDHFSRDFLMGAERDPSSDQDFRRFGGVDRRSTATNPANVCSTGSGNLPGLPTRCATVPPGSTGIGLTPASFTATAGQTNFDSLDRYRSIVPQAERDSVAAFGDFEISSTLSLFGELFWSRRQDDSILGPMAVTNRTVPAANAFNPFGVPVVVNYLLTGVEPRRAHAEAESLRPVLGLRGIHAGWDWEISALAFIEDGESANFNFINAAALTAAIASNNPNTALNLFQDGPGGSAALLSSLITPATTTPSNSQGIQYSAFARGDLFSTRAGSVQAVVGAEQRAEILDLTSVRDAERESQSVFIEARIPLASHAAPWPIADELSVSLALRFDVYDDFGETLNPQYGIQWRPVSPLLLRASYGTSFRAPSLFELYQTPTAVTSTIQDPRRNNQSSTFTNFSGGNPNLDPEESTSFAAGFVLTPWSDSDFRLGLNYWSISQDTRIQRFSTLLLLANEAFFPARIVRATPTPADVAAGFPGAIVSIDSTSINFGPLDTSGIDLEIGSSASTSLGNFSTSLMVTWVNEYVAADFPNTPATDRVGVAQSLGTVPEWRGTASLVWSNGPFSGGATFRYVSGYRDTTLNAFNGLEVDEQFTVDLQASLDIGEATSVDLLDGIVVRAGVVNVFDEAPPFSDVLQSGYDNSLSDIRQRFAYLRFTKEF